MPITEGTPNGTVISASLGIVNDGIDEPAESFTLNISTAAPGTSAVPTQTIVILDDVPGPFGFAATAEGQGDATTASSPARAPGRSAIPVGAWKNEGAAAPSPQALTWTTRPPEQGEVDRRQQPEGAGR